MRTRLEYFMTKVDKNGPAPKGFPELGPCWIWTGANDRKDKQSYGVFGTGTKNAQGNVITTKAHRWSYEHFVGPVPKDLDVLQQMRCKDLR